MASSLPIACSLSTEDRSQRAHEIASLSDRVLAVHSEGGRGAVVSFQGDMESKARLERLVDAEQECCPFLDLSLSERGSELMLSIRGPEGAEPVIGEIVGALTRG
jgi:hypothetical protein